MSMYENVGLTSLDYIEEILHLRKALAAVSDECSKAYDKIANFEQQRWVSVKDRLPDKIGKVLVIDNGKVDINSWAGKYEGWYYANKNITHWMPLPEPPKVNDDG